MRRAIRSVLGAVCLVVLIGCEKSQKVETASQVQDLPESGVKISPSEWREHLIGAARSYLDEVVRPAAAFYEQWPLVSGQMEAASVRLSENMYREDRTPLALYGVHGIDGQGRPYLSVTVLNEHRETTALWLMIYHNDRPIVRVRVELSLQEKDPGLILPHWFNIIPRSWDDSDMIRSSNNAAIQLHATRDRYVEMPSLADCTIAVGAEDRINGLGNFVLISEKDEDP